MGGVWGQSHWYSVSVPVGSSPWFPPSVDLAELRPAGKMSRFMNSVSCLRGEFTSISSQMDLQRSATVFETRFPGPPQGGEICKTRRRDIFRASPSNCTQSPYPRPWYQHSARGHSFNLFIHSIIHSFNLYLKRVNLGEALMEKPSFAVPPR